MSDFSISKASKIWGISRTTLYKKLELWELSLNQDKTISMVEMIRVFGEPKQTKTVQHRKKVNIDEQLWTNEILQLKLELERQKTLNEQLLKQLDDCKERVNHLETLLNKSLDDISGLIKVQLLEAPKTDTTPRKKFLGIF